jgi:hypothetical protein
MRLALATAFVIATACTRDRYRADVYPDHTDTHRRIFAGEYETLKDCRTAGHSVLVALDRYHDGFYECGRDCRPSSLGGPDTLWHCAVVTEVHGVVVITR